MIEILNNWVICYFIGTILSFIIYWSTDKLVNDTRYALWLKYPVFNNPITGCHKCFNTWTNVFFVVLFFLVGLYKASIFQAIFGGLYTGMIIYKSEHWDR